MNTKEGGNFYRSKWRRRRRTGGDVRAADFGKVTMPGTDAFTNRPFQVRLRRPHSLLVCFQSSLKSFGLSSCQRCVLQQPCQLGVNILRTKEVRLNLKKSHRVFDSETVSSLNLLQSRRVATGKSQCIILAVELRTRLRPLCARLGTAVSPLDRLMDAVVQLGNAFGVLLNDASWLKLLFHGGASMPNDPIPQPRGSRPIRLRQVPRRDKQGRVDCNRSAMAGFEAAHG